VTGGGLADNLARVLPPGVDAVIDRATWTPPAVMELIGRLGPVEAAELERTLNLGVGMVGLVPDGPSAVALLADRGLTAWVAGEAVRGAGKVRLVGTHRS
jgi:phosphoribosylformylglycinamidine cyclo-ligase